MKKEEGNRWCRGSFTVEAAMLMGIVLFTILSVLNETKTIYNRVLVTAYAYECEITKRESEIAGMWGTAEEPEVELEELNPVAFLRRTQIVKQEMG